MTHHLNTLFVTTQGAYLSRQGEALLVRVEKETKLRVPIHTLGGVVCFGRVGLSPSLMGLCGERGVAISMLTEHGKFLARVSGWTPGNVLLRREQYRRADDAVSSAKVARPIVAAKVANSRSVLLRALRDYPDCDGADALRAAADRMAAILADLLREQTLDSVRGLEGEAAAAYFGAFAHLIRQKDGFTFGGRTRRPPLDNVNALLSFLYAMLAHDARAACEAAGLDAAVGFLHRDRPGRPGLALDLMEEFRAYIADRLVLSLINRKQVDAGGFKTPAGEGGGVEMDDKTRKAVLVAYQNRKKEQIVHPFLGEKVSVGLLVHLHARLLARYLRGDLDAYPPFVWS